MFKTIPRCEAQISVGTTAICARPLRQRVLAGLLAVTFTLSSCGDAFDASPQDASETASAQMHLDENPLDADRVLNGSTRKNSSDNKPIEECVIADRVKIDSLTSAQKDIITKAWAPPPRPRPWADDLRRRHLLTYPTPEVSRLNHSLLQSFPARIRPLPTFSVKFDKMGWSTAYFIISVRLVGNRRDSAHGLSRAQCRELTNYLKKFSPNIVSGKQTKGLPSERGEKASFEEIWKKIPVPFQLLIIDVTSAVAGGTVAIGVQTVYTRNIPLQRDSPYIMPSSTCLGTLVGGVIALAGNGAIADWKYALGAVVTAGLECTIGFGNLYSRLRTRGERVAAEEASRGVAAILRIALQNSQLVGNLPVDALSNPALANIVTLVDSVGVAIAAHLRELDP